MKLHNVRKFHYQLPGSQPQTFKSIQAHFHLFYIQRGIDTNA